MWKPERIVLHPDARKYALTQTILDRLATVPIIQAKNEAELGSFVNNKRTLILRPTKGEMLKPCPGTITYRCCGYQILNTGLNCGFDCTYCILQDYLKEKAQTVFVDLPDQLGSLKQKIQKEPDRVWRIGTGEFTDSLIHDPWTGLSGLLVEWARDLPNIILELKTKSIYIDELLKHPASPNVVVAWSVNTDRITHELELGAPTVKNRLVAARRIAQHGYSIAFHFDPIVPYSGFELEYQKVVEKIFDTILAERVRWISLGVLRFTKGMYDLFKRRSPQYLGDMILAPDQKWRYPRLTRIKGYQAVLSSIRVISPDLYVYLCMESPEVWRAVMGADPGSNDVFTCNFDEAVFGVKRGV